MTRFEMIEWLVANDIEYVAEGSSGQEWVASILRFGFEGYADQPDEVLRREILERDEEAFNHEAYHFEEEI